MVEDTVASDDGLIPVDFHEALAESEFPALQASCELPVAAVDMEVDPLDTEANSDSLEDQRPGYDAREHQLGVLA